MKITTGKPSQNFGHFGVIVSAAAVCVLAGCASKPTYNSSSKTATVSSTQVITDSRGVPNRYQVKQGDTVAKIAQRYGLNWREIGKINNLNSSYTIYTGQWLTLWTAAAGSRESSKTTPATTTSSQKTTASNNQKATATPTPTPPKPVAQSATTATIPPFASGSSGVMQFRYPVGTSNPVVRRFGTANVAGSTVTSNGMWFSGRDGDPIAASNAGTVIQADRNMDGASIVIQHTNGFVSSYIHIKDAQVKSGDSVRMGQRIASMKNQATGTALFEFRVARNGVYVDPLTVLK